jgi:O-succinylbenzoic acid--CoA ligase
VPSIRRAERSAPRRQRRRVVVDGPLEAGRGRASAADTTSTPGAIVVHHVGHERAPKRGRADLRQLAVERARVGRRARLDPAERWLCALPLAHVGGLSIVLRSAITPRPRLVHERFETERRARRPAGDPDGPTIVSLVRRRCSGCSTPG